ncbi:MAG TPA: septal ring lytic transglycosylase RlpA family protein [Allosphingosinicella sp.]|jgi:rare lipoprotein A|uniref:septal ring lytic transglycosylase RlpA family protein n=1 Tax=Allosphingosinicella sp. TaxID=2823234 RepID=UPI002F2AD34C
MTVFQARFGAKALFALATAGLMTSSAGNATIPMATAEVIRSLEEVAPVLPEAEVVIDESAQANVEHVGDGVASFYGRELAGNRTASGERFNPQALTAAHRTLPLGSKLKVTNKANGKSVVVRINDRGPFHGRRVLDVSLAAAHQIGMYRAGKATVRMELLR